MMTRLSSRGFDAPIVMTILSSVTTAALGNAQHGVGLVANTGTQLTPSPEKRMRKRWVG